MVYRNIKTGLEIIVSSEINAPNFVRVDNETPQTAKSGESSNEDKPRKKRAKK